MLCYGSFLTFQLPACPPRAEVHLEALGQNDDTLCQVYDF